MTSPKKAAQEESEKDGTRPVTKETATSGATAADVGSLRPPEDSGSMETVTEDGGADLAQTHQQFVREVMEITSNIYQEAQSEKVSQLLICVAYIVIYK